MGKEKAKKKNRSIRHAIRQISSHPSVIAGSLKGGLSNAHTGLIEYEFSLEVPLPSRCRKKGISTTGVKKSEEVILAFSTLYPYKAPRICLRKNFPRSFPHINPGDANDYVEPCIFDGNINELVFSEDGMLALINQLSEWLKKAAGNTLINPSQGWEPIRRDSINGRLVYDLQEIRREIQSKKDFRACLCRCVFGRDFRGLIFNPSISRSFGDKVKQIRILQDAPERIDAITVGIFAWSNEFRDDGTPMYIDFYVPDTVTNYEQLLDMARSYGCYEPLNEAIQILLITMEEGGIQFPSPYIPIILCVRRPYKLIGDDSTLELIPYLLECQTDGRSNKVKMESPVIPLAHRHQLSQNLLRRMSIGEETVPKGRIVMLGCGSLGSKIALHLARGGYGPFTLVDYGLLSPHNLARHALTNAGVVTLSPKAEALCKEINKFTDAKENSEFIHDDIISFISRETLPKDTKLIIDSTASDSVREYLSSVNMGRFPYPIVRVSLFAEGKCGAIIVEGENRNPRIDDLYIRLFDLAIDDIELSRKILSSTGQRYGIGQNCGSFTMIMPDTIVSFHASSMAEKARQLIHQSFNKKGELLIGRIGDDNIGVSWEKIMLGPTIMVENHNAFGWEIRILDNASKDIISESIKYGNVETGGVLFGKISITKRCITISRVLPAPPDSVRTTTEFVLGTEGLKEIVKKAQEASGILRYLGTWHSHPMGGEYSSKDKAMLERMKELRFPAPSVCLIYKPDGPHSFSCLVDEGDFGYS